jgi:trimeric autotransporter adhesin
LSNLAVAPLLLTGTPKVDLSGSSDFTLTAQPNSPIAGYGASTTFKVRFTPITGGLKTASLAIPNSDADEGLFTINLAGTALSFTTDTDGDGLNDAAEFNMAPLNFKWQEAQPALVDTYFANAGGAGFQTQAQIQALHPGATLLTKNPANGRFKVTTRWEKSTNLVDFFNFPAPAGSAVSINPSGKIEFEFEVPERAAFFRIGQP